MTNGSDILLDEIPTSINWNNYSSLSATEMSNLYGLSSSDFAPGGGIWEKCDGKRKGTLHKFVKLKLQGIPGTLTGVIFTLIIKTSGGKNVTRWFPKTFGDGVSLITNCMHNLLQMLNYNLQELMVIGFLILKTV